MFDHMWDLDAFMLVHQRDEGFDHPFRLSHQHIGNGYEGWRLWIKKMISLQVCLHNIDQNLPPTRAHISLELDSWCDVLLNFLESHHLLVFLHHQYMRLHLHINNFHKALHALPRQKVFTRLCFYTSSTMFVSITILRVSFMSNDITAS